MSFFKIEMAIFQDLFLVLILTEVVVKKRFLGHHQKFEKVPLKSADKNKF